MGADVGELTGLLKVPRTYTTKRAVDRVMRRLPYMSCKPFLIILVSPSVSAFPDMTTGMHSFERTVSARDTVTLYTNDHPCLHTQRVGIGHPLAAAPCQPHARSCSRND